MKNILIIEGNIQLFDPIGTLLFSVSYSFLGINKPLLIKKHHVNILKIIRNRLLFK